MPVPASRAELLDAIDVTFTKLTADLDQVPASTVRDATMDGHVKGTRMSPADLVAYLIGWNTQVLVWCRRREDGLPDAFPASDLGWNELGALAQRFYCEHAEESWESLRLQLDTAQRNVVELVERLDNEQLYGAPWYGKWTLGRMISLNTSSPYANARKRIRAWLRTLDARTQHGSSS